MMSTGEIEYGVPKHISDRRLLSMINKGLVVIRKLRSRDPELFVRGNAIKARLNEQGGYRRIFGNSRWRWEIYDGMYVDKDGKKVKRRRQIVRAKLVWMYVNRRVVPRNHRIHHGDEDRFNDSINNLECLDDNTHSELHYGTF